MSIEMNNKIVALQIEVQKLKERLANFEQVYSPTIDIVDELKRRSDRAEEERIHCKGLRVRTDNGTQRNQKAKASKAPF